MGSVACITKQLVYNRLLPSFWRREQKKRNEKLSLTFKTIPIFVGRGPGREGKKRNPTNAVASRDIFLRTIYDLELFFISYFTSFLRLIFGEAETVRNA